MDLEGEQDRWGDGHNVSNIVNKNVCRTKQSHSQLLGMRRRRDGYVNCQRTSDVALLNYDNCPASMALSAWCR